MGRKRIERLDKHVWWTRHVRLESERLGDGFGIGTEVVVLEEEKAIRAGDPTYTGDRCWVYCVEVKDSSGVADGWDETSSVKPMEEVGKISVTRGGRSMRVRRAIWEEFASIDTIRWADMKRQAGEILIPSLPEESCARNCVNPWHVKMLEQQEFYDLQAERGRARAKKNAVRKVAGRAEEVASEKGFVAVEVPFLGRMLVRDVALQLILPLVVKKEANEDWDFIGPHSKGIGGLPDWEGIEKELNQTIRLDADGALWVGWGKVQEYVEWLLCEKPDILEEYHNR